MSLLAVAFLVSAANARGAPSELPVSTGTAMQVAFLLSALTLLPAVVMSITPFLRITLVLHFLRQALGTQTVPSSQVLIGLSLFLTAVLMQPIARRVYDDAWRPYSAGTITGAQAFEKGLPPVRQHLLRFAREKDVALMVDIAKAPRPKSPNDLPVAVLAPAYVLSELRSGFQIGAVLFLPFLVVDLIVASVTLSVGMVQLPPAMVSAPFKILLFVLADGWNLVVGSLMRSLNP